jgi:hypothetical protein
MRVAYLLLALLVATPVFAQDEKPESKIDLAVAFPATTMVYMRADTNDYFETLNPKELFNGLEGDFSLPDLGELARKQLELNLTDAEAGELASGVRRFSAGLLDVALSGPKFAIVIEHKDLKALARALKEAQKEGVTTVPDVQDYDGTLVYEIEVPLPATEARDDFTPDLNPFSSWMSNQAYWVSIFDNYLVIATSDNAVKDSIDYLSYPEDPMDTLLGNSRYKQAIADFVKPQAVLFVNVQSVINTIERLAGDKGSSAGMFEMFTYFLGSSEEIQFYVNLIQYEQFKSFAAGFWLDEISLTVRMDANLVFHNPPGWFENVRVEPKPMPLTEFIPSDSMLAITECVEDVNGMYGRAKEFFFSRAKAAGHARLVEAWENWEKNQTGRDVTLEQSLSHLGSGQAVVILPKEKVVDFTDAIPEVGFILGVKDRKKAEEFFYGKLMQSPQREIFRDMEGEITGIVVVNGIEIHHDNEGQYAFAFLDGADAGGVFVVGKLSVVKRVVEAKTAGSNLISMPAWRDARQLLYETGSAHIYVNFGAVLRSGASLNPRNIMWGGWDPGERVNTLDRDDTERDDDPIPYLAEFFGKTVIVGSARSDESRVSFRLAAAGWPDRNRMRELALHYRDVERNRQVRDDFVRVRYAAPAYLAIKGKPAKEPKQLIESGVLDRKEWAVDPYGADDGKDREYLLAQVPDDIDIRQAILCAYQQQPGLRGNHMALLWNTHIVELTPEGLKKAIELARKGEPLPAEGMWYRELLKPLHSENDPRNRVDSVDWPDETKVEVEIIDDEGNETTVEVDEQGLQGKTEEILDKKETEKPVD